MHLVDIIFTNKSMTSKYNYDIHITIDWQFYERKVDIWEVIVHIIRGVLLDFSFQKNIDNFFF